MSGRCLPSLLLRCSKASSWQRTSWLQTFNSLRPWEALAGQPDHTDSSDQGGVRGLSRAISLSRGFSTDTRSIQKPLSVEEAQGILKKVDAAHLGNLIRKESQTRWNMHYDDLVNLCCESDTAPNREEAQTICDALDKAGVVLRVKNLVYLRPLEVAEILYQALPDTEQEVRAKLDGLKAEAEPLLQQKAKIDSHAHRVSKAVLWTGLAVFTVQVVVYARLTFWELSWDVMEPVSTFPLLNQLQKGYGFHTVLLQNMPDNLLMQPGETFAILAYIYCLWYNEEFGYQKAKSRINQSIQNKKYAEKGLNKAKLDYLLDRINNLEQTLSPKYSVDHSNQSQEEGSSGAAPAAAKAGLKTIPTA